MGRSQFAQPDSGAVALAGPGAARNILENLYGPAGQFASAKNPIANAGAGFGDFINTQGNQYRVTRDQHGRPSDAAVNQMLAALFSQFAQSMNPTPPGMGGMFGGTNPTSTPAPAPMQTPVPGPTTTPQATPNPVPAPEGTPTSLIQQYLMRR